MNRWNKAAIIMWVFAACIGYLIGGDIKGAVFGLSVGLGISLIAERFS